MITVTIKPREVKIEGHAERQGDKEYNLVCCAVSTLYYSLCANLQKYDDTTFSGESGDAVVRVEKFSRDKAQCFRFFRVAINELAKQYKSVKIIDKRKKVE